MPGFVYYFLYCIVVGRRSIRDVPHWGEKISLRFATRMLVVYNEYNNVCYSVWNLPSSSKWGNPECLLNRLCVKFNIPQKLLGEVIFSVNIVKQYYTKQLKESKYTISARVGILKMVTQLADSVHYFYLLSLKEFTSFGKSGSQSL